MNNHKRFATTALGVSPEIYEAMEEEWKRPAHRPPLPAEQRRSETIRIRATQEEAAKFERLGGLEWFRRHLERAKG